MYVEFVIIYVGLGAVLVLLAAIIVLLLVLMKKVGKISPGKTGFYSGNGIAAGKTAGVVFCKKCAAELEASERICPKCGTPR